MRINQIFIYNLEKNVSEKPPGSTKKIPLSKIIIISFKIYHENKHWKILSGIYILINIQSKFQFVQKCVR